MVCTYSDLYSIVCSHPTYSSQDDCWLQTLKVGKIYLTLDECAALLSGIEATILGTTLMHKDDCRLLESKKSEKNWHK